MAHSLQLRILERFNQDGHLAPSSGLTAQDGLLHNRHRTPPDVSRRNCQLELQSPHEREQQSL
jgi:hypothetical protein